jgi:hypothetical protein
LNGTKKGFKNRFQTVFATEQKLKIFDNFFVIFVHFKEFVRMSVFSNVIKLFTVVIYSVRFVRKCVYYLEQGTLTEREGIVRLTSSFRKEVKMFAILKAADVILT